MYYHNKKMSFKTRQAAATAALTIGDERVWTQKKAWKIANESIARTQSLLDHIITHYRSINLRKDAEIQKWEELTNLLTWWKKEGKLQTFKTSTFIEKRSQVVNLTNERKNLQSDRVVDSIQQKAAATEGQLEQSLNTYFGWTRQQTSDMITQNEHAKRDHERNLRDIDMAFVAWEQKHFEIMSALDAMMEEIKRS